MEAETTVNAVSLPFSVVHLKGFAAPKYSESKMTTTSPPTPLPKKDTWVWVNPPKILSLSN